MREPASCPRNVTHLIQVLVGLGGLACIQFYADRRCSELNEVNLKLPAKPLGYRESYTHAC